MRKYKKQGKKKRLPPTELEKLFLKELRAYLKNKNITHEKLANLLDVSPRFICYWFAYKRRLSLDRMEEIKNILDLSIRLDIRSNTNERIASQHRNNLPIKKQSKSSWNSEYQR